MAALPYMQLYVSDYLSDTAHLTTEEHGAYLLLLFNYWQTGKPLRADRLATVARMSNDRWNSVEQTLSEFFNIDVNPGSWTHLRVESDLHQVASKATQASDAGKKSALARALAKQALQTDASTTVATGSQRKGNHTDTDTDTEQNQDQKNLLKFDQKSAFDIFWRLYPRKVSKAPSEKKFMTKCKDAETFAQIIRSVGEHIQNAWDLSEMNFIPHASAWLNQERWNDEVSHVRPKPTNTGTSGQSRPSLVEQVRQRGRELEAERGGQAGYGSAPDGELPPAWLETGGIDWEGEFSRIDVSDGSLMGTDD